MLCLFWKFINGRPDFHFNGKLRKCLNIGIIPVCVVYCWYNIKNGSTINKQLKLCYPPLQHALILYAFWKSYIPVDWIRKTFFVLKKMFALIFEETFSLDLQFVQNSYWKHSTKIQIKFSVKSVSWMSQSGVPKKISGSGV